MSAGAIAYDPSRTALYRPAQRPTVFVPGHEFSLDAICAECSRLAYLHFERTPAARDRLADALRAGGLGALQVFGDARTGTEAYAALHDASGSALIVFRGTEPGDFADAATDLAVRPVAWERGGHVHSGFGAAFAGVRAEIERWLDANAGDAALVLTGHSLGAALATLAMSAWRGARLVTFGCPRVGDATFVATLEPTRIARHVGCCDLVCNAPPAGRWYTDAGPGIYIDREGILRAGIGPAAIAADRRRARIDYALLHATRRGNVLVRDLADHAAINYVRALI